MRGIHGRRQVLREKHVVIPTKPVFKIKDEWDGLKWYKVWIVTKGFLMIPGVDYMESLLPVNMKTEVWCVISISLHFINEDIALNIPAERRWILAVYNVQAAFLNADLGGHMYIKKTDKMIEPGFVTKKDQNFLYFIGSEHVWQCGCNNYNSLRSTVVLLCQI